MSQILLYEDDLVPQLYPVVVGRPAFAVACGGYRLCDLLAELNWPIACRVRDHLRQIVELDYTACCRPLVEGRPVLVLNARLVPSALALAEIGTIGQMSLRSSALFRTHDGQLAAAWLTAADAQRAAQATEPLQQFLPTLSASTKQLPEGSPLALFDYPHDIVRHHLKIFAGNVAHRLRLSGLEQTTDGVFLAPGAKLGPYITTDTSQGPIVLEAGATVGPYCYLRGPVWLGPGTRVLEHSVLKDGVAAGHTVKIGGEVEASIIEAYTNKQHHGFLGHTYLGSWINLGAGTCNSDLKNTYGTVNMEYRGRKVSSGMQFIGAIVGDYAKTAINTGIFTGKTVGVCSMVYGYVTTNVPSFVNYARLFGQLTEAPVEVMVSTQRRMFERRGVEQRPCDIQLLHDMHALTTHERQALGETLSIEPLSL
jgi:glucose-1-phosphate thymidylyltransferase